MIDNRKLDEAEDVIYKNLDIYEVTTSWCVSRFIGSSLRILSIIINKLSILCEFAEQNELELNRTASQIESIHEAVKKLREATYWLSEGK